MADNGLVLCCGGILCERTHRYELPDGWTGGADAEGSMHVLCPDCQPQGAWFESQCPGCVSGPGECGLWDAFAYTHSHGLSPSERVQIKAGICPFRVNGTFELGPDGSRTIDLSERAPNGEHVLAAIDAYREKYRIVWG